MIGKIKRTFTFLDKEIFNNLCKALVRPHLDYGKIQLYAEYNKTNVRKFTFSNRFAPAWNARALITISAPNINKFKNLLDRDPDLLVNKFDCNFFFF